MTHSGDFSAEAYEQLRQAYADQLTTQDQQELEGYELLGQKMTLETLPVDSPWRERIKDWQYPNGKSAFMDGKQSPEEILEVMRQSVMERKEAKEAEEEMTDEELDTLLDEILNSDEEAAEDEAEEEESEETEEEPEEEAEEEEEEVVDDEDIPEDLDGVAPEELEEEGEADEPAESYEVEEEEVEDEAYDPEQVAEEIAALKEQIEAFRFAPTEEEPNE